MNHVSHLSGEEQRANARTPRKTMHRPDRDATTPAPRKFVAKGHDSQLQDAQMNNLHVEIATINEGLYRGTISRRDKYTVTLKLEKGAFAGQDLILYKHAIESIMIVRQTVTKESTEAVE